MAAPPTSIKALLIYKLNIQGKSMTEKNFYLMIFLVPMVLAPPAFASSDLPLPNGKDNYSAYVDCKYLAGNEQDDSRKECTKNLEIDLKYNKGSAQINNYSCRKDADERYKANLDSCTIKYMPSRK